jgi:hypothetical protein
MARRVLIESKPSITKVGSQGTPLEYYVQTEYQVDDNGKLIAGTQKSYIAYNNSTIPGIKNFVQAAETSNGGASWTFKNGIDGKPIFGADAQKSLKEGALKTDTQNAISSSAQKASQPLSNEDQKQLAASTKNQAPDTVNTEESQRALGEELEKSKTFSRFNFPQDLRYPADLQIDYQDVIQFNMLRYEPRNINTSANQGLGSIGERSNYTSRIIGKVFLPIPGGISDTNAVTWGGDEISPLGKTLAEFANSFITEGPSAAAGTAGTQLENVQKSSSDLKTALTAIFTSQAIGKSNILSRTKGAVFNPNMELLFSGPTLRPFNFTFKLSARGTKDRDAIRQIIRFFKQGMAVQRTQSQLFLKAPHTFKIQYLHKTKDHSYLNLIKECALQSFTVNYTPEGNYMTFADGMMTSYEISMQFQELEPIFNDDYGNLDGKSIDTNIGY